MPESDRKMVVMTKRVAERWLREVSFPEHRVRVLYGTRETRNLASLLHSFRDARVTLQGVPVVADLGVRETSDGLEMWSRDREGLKALTSWFERRGFETSGIW